MSLDSAEGIAKLAQKAVQLSMSVRQVEGAVYNLLHPEPPEEPKPAKPADPNVREAERMLQAALGVKVQIKDNRGKGKIVLEYKSLEDFDRVLELLEVKH
jgi:ParB family chromosome partitioning protein